MDKFLEKYNLPKLNEEEAESLNRQVKPKEIETVTKKLPTHKALDQTVSQENSTEHLGGANPHPPQIMSKNSRRRKTPKLILRSLHHPNPKTR